MLRSWRLFWKKPMPHPNFFCICLFFILLRPSRLFRGVILKETSTLSYFFFAFVSFSFMLKPSRLFWGEGSNYKGSRSPTIIFLYFVFHLCYVLQGLYWEEGTILKEVNAPAYFEFVFFLSLMLFPSRLIWECNIEEIHCPPSLFSVFFFIYAISFFCGWVFKWI